MALQGDIVEKDQKKRGIHSEKGGKVDRISELHDCILLYILAFLTSKEAIQTCILSKRWKDLWKSLYTLIANDTHFRTAKIFKNFISKVLVHRNRSLALHNIDIEHNGYVPSQMLDKLIKYSTSHNVEQFKLRAYICGHIRKDIVLSCSMFSCRSLKSLDLSLSGFNGKAILPKTLDFPQLVDCRLKDVAFSLSNNGCAEPFSICKELSTLVIDSCTLHNAQALCVYSDKLASLTIRFDIFGYYPCKIQISTPNLNSFSFVGRIATSIGELFSDKLNFLEKVSIDVWTRQQNSVEIAETLKSWLKMFTNVNSVAFTSYTLQVLSWIGDLSNIQPIDFCNLMSLNLRHQPGSPFPGEVLNYLLEGSPLAKVKITEGVPQYYDEIGIEYDMFAGAHVIENKKMRSMTKNLKYRSC